ncbi:hypothetical protein FOL47_000781 [Perkinsus chesapeaki]|uniref:sn-1-specific diacylglycerol lipase n=1 Tax=Perkinsus chesapeaki TaxID=330153 RepID=A0A7J6KVG2_PERCH|nr:hypothetical protein FOL47_000781 [Perkinsus chesapeaki]
MSAPSRNNVASCEADMKAEDGNSPDSTAAISDIPTTAPDSPTSTEASFETAIGEPYEQAAAETSSLVSSDSDSESSWASSLVKSIFQPLDQLIKAADAKSRAARETAAQAREFRDIWRKIFERSDLGSLSKMDLVIRFRIACQLCDISLDNVYDNLPQVTLPDPERALRYLTATQVAYAAFGKSKKAECALQPDYVLEYCPQIADVVFISTQCGQNRPVFYVLHSVTNAVVVVVRGTKSVADAVTDSFCDTARFTDSPIDEGYEVHRGMGIAANFVARTGMPYVLKALDKWKSNRLILLGHSLGAGTAILTGVLLARVLAVKVECYTFGCPPITTKRDMPCPANLTMTTFVNEDDIVARLSLRGIDEVLNSINPKDREMAPRTYIPGTVYLLKSDDSNNTTVVYKTDGSCPALSAEAMLYYCMQISGNRAMAMKSLNDHGTAEYQKKLTALVRSADEEWQGDLAEAAASGGDLSAAAQICYRSLRYTITTVTAASFAVTQMPWKNSGKSFCEEDPEGRSDTPTSGLVKFLDRAAIGLDRSTRHAMETSANLCIIESILRGLLGRTGIQGLTLTEALKFLIKMCRGDPTVTNPDLHTQGCAAKLDNPAEVRAYMRAASSAYGAEFLNALGIEKITGHARLDEPLDLSCIMAHCPDICEVIHMSQPKGANEPAYFIAVDKDNTVILSIRGSAGVSDMITDLMCDNTELSSSPEDRRYLVHRGIGAAARNTASDAFPLIRDIMSSRGANKLVITGHSLGAGVALLTSILLARELPCSVECYAFAPPPVTTTTSPTTCQNLTLQSFVNQDDLIPRLSLRGAEDLFDTITPEETKRSMAGKAVTLMIPGQIYVFDPTMDDTIWATDGYNPSLGPQAMVYYCQRLCGKPFGKRLDASKCLSDHLPDIYESRLQRLVEIYDDNSA